MRAKSNYLFLLIINECSRKKKFSIIHHILDIFYVNFIIEKSIFSLEPLKTLIKFTDFHNLKIVFKVATLK